jgi:phospholipid transport system substrate-binding protein
VEARVWKCGVVANGVSLVKNYRGQFDKIIRESGYPDLVEELRKKSKEAKPPKPKK